MDANKPDDRPRLSLLTDLYQLTMAYGYWKEGMDQRRAAFHLFFRENPFDGGFTVSAGLGSVISYLENLRFEREELEYLAVLKGNDDRPLFEKGFLEYLGQLRFSCDVDATPEGTAVFPQEPILRIEGPIAQCQIVETPLLNAINFQSLIATKAARMCLAAGEDPVVEFGLRRAQGVDGAMAASRAAYVGGCYGTSNVMAGQRYGMPVVGTHAHSWVMAFDSEREAFERYARVMPNNSTLLVDTYDTLEGVRHATEIGRALLERGHRLSGIRLDSGDLAYLSIEARKILDDAGFDDALIVASNNLDEYIIDSLKRQGARIDVWGVGTKLVTAYDQPALGGVYKLGAIQVDDIWRPRIKLSEQASKVTTPGRLHVRRFTDGGTHLGDLIYDPELGVSSPVEIVDPQDATRRKRVSSGVTSRELLVPIFRRGVRTYEEPSLEEIRALNVTDLACLHPTIKRFMNAHEYPVGLERNLHRLRTHLILDARGHDSEGGKVG